MQNSKIAQLRENVRTWNSPDGTLFYVHNVQLENGVQGSAFGKSPNAPYQVGDAVQYEERRTNDGTRLKIRKESSYQGGGYSGRHGNPDKEQRIMRQSAMKVAAEIVGQGKHFSEYVAVAENCIKYFKNGNGNSQGQNAPAVETRNTNTTSTTGDAFPF